MTAPLSHQFASRKACVAVLPPAMRSDGAPPANVASGVFPPRLRAFWNQQARQVLAEEINALEAARARIAERIITREMHQHANTMELYAARLASVDPDGNREEVDRLRRVAQRARDFAADLGEA